MRRGSVVLDVETFIKVAAAITVALFALGLWASPSWAQVTSLDKTGPDEVLAGEEFTYTIAVRTDAAAEPDVVVKDVLPTGVDLAGPLPANCTATEALNVITVTCDLDEVPANTTETITLNVEAPEAAPQTITNTATVIVPGGCCQTLSQLTSSLQQTSR